MGFFRKPSGDTTFRSSNDDRAIELRPNITVNVATTPNPNPYRFSIEEIWPGEKYVLLKVNYPDATTFEGNKLLLMEGISVKDILKLKSIDPHFFKGGKIIARFAPTKKGLALAKKFL